MDNYSTVWLPEGNWPNLLSFLAQRFPGVPTEDWHERMRHGGVWDADGRALKPDAPYQGLRHLHYRRKPVSEPEVPFEAQVLFEDELIVVADKPHFLPVTPSGAYMAHTLQTRLRKQLNCPKLQVVHRLDRETAGLVLLVKNAALRGAYQTLFAQRQVSKRYLAIAPALSPQLASPLRHESRLVPSGQFFLQQEQPGPVNSVTEISLCKPLAQGRALYTLRPMTGKKHQLRVHMASIGCPIEGDRFYPVAQKSDPLDFSKPLQLLAQELIFHDPITLERRYFQTQRVLDGVNSPAGAC